MFVVPLSATSETTVLVVDDEQRFVEAHARMLPEQYAVRKASGGHEALDIIDDTIDIVLLDREMPGLDGDEVASKIRNRGLDCRIVLLTAVEPDVDIIELGIQDYLTKPVDENELTECIEELLEWEEYDNPTADFFALSNKREVLLQEGGEELNADQLSELQQRIKQKAEEGLQKNREVLETLIQSSPAAIVTLDTDGKIDLWNPSAEDIFGWEADEVIGELPPIFSDDTREELETIRNRLFTDSIVTDMDIGCVTKSGAPLDISLSAAPLYDNEGSMYGMMFLMVDITERKQREQHINVLNRVLRHNLRNDMNVIIGRAAALSDSLEGSKAEHMNTIVDVSEELLQMSEKARQMQEALSADSVAVEERDVEKIIDHNVEKLEDEFPAVEVTVDFQIDDTNVIASEGLTIAIWNILENAVEHNDTDTPEIKITVSDDFTDDEKSKTVSISDNGPGIPREEITVLDQEAESALSHGSGIGLWVIKWMLDRSGADLAFDINDRGGTTARVTLRETRDTSYQTGGVELE